MFWPCHRRCPGCVICRDTYSSGSGEGGSGAHVTCEWTGAEDWFVDSSGVLHASPGEAEFLDDPISHLDSVKLSLLVLPESSGGPARVRLKLGILPGGGHVYGDLFVTGAGAVLISVGSDEGELAEVEVTPSGGLGSGSGMHQLGLCWRPPVPLQETSGSFGGFPIEVLGAPPAPPERGWVDVQNAVSDSPQFASTDGSLGTNEQGTLTARWQFTLPPAGFLVGASVEVRCQSVGTETQIHDVAAVLSVGGVTLGDRAEDTDLPNSFALKSYGGSTDLWDTVFGDVTSEATNDVGALFTWTAKENNGDGGNQVDVDYIALRLNFVFHNRIPGRLSFLLRISGSGADWCVVSASPPMTSGSLAGIEVLQDDWQLDNYNLAYMFDAADRPGCQVCGDCLNLQTHPADCGSCCLESDELSQSLSVTGFSMSSDNCCNKGAGTIILEPPGGSGGAVCLWQYQEFLQCSPSGTRLFIVNATIVADPVTGQCFWEVTVLCGQDGTTVVQDPSDPDNNVVTGGGLATYRSAELEGGCDQFPYTLTRVDTAGDLAITVPNTITLDEAGTEA